MAIKLIIANDYREMSKKSARIVANKIKDNNKQDRRTVLGCATNKTFVGFYKELARMCNEEDINLSTLITFNLDEYLDKDGDLLSDKHRLSYRRYMYERFFDLILSKDRKVKEKNIHFPDPRNIEAYSRKIEEFGGIDVQLLGIGFNGHIGFNEPPEPSRTISLQEFKNSGTRVVSLTEQTIATNARLTTGGNISAVPTKAVTMGMKDILGVKEIILLACFPEQAEVISRVLNGPITPQVPASFLQNHPNCRFIITKEAATKL